MLSRVARVEHPSQRATVVIVERRSREGVGQERGEGGREYCRRRCCCTCHRRRQLLSKKILILLLVLKVVSVREGSEAKVFFKRKSSEGVRIRGSN